MGYALQNELYLVYVVYKKSEQVKGKLRLTRGQVVSFNLEGLCWWSVTVTLTTVSIESEVYLWLEKTFFKVQLWWRHR